MIKIDPEFRALIRPQTDTERKHLEDMILADGCRDPLVVWLQPCPKNGEHKCYGDGNCDLRAGDGVWTCQSCNHNPALMEGVLVDGHNRYEICTKHGIGYKIEPMEFADRDAAMQWIDKNQLARRNLTRDEFQLIVGRVYEREKKAEHDGGAGKSRSGDQNEPHFKTAEKVGAEYGVSPATVKRAGKFYQKVEEVKAEQKSKAEMQVEIGRAFANNKKENPAPINYSKPEESIYTEPEAPEQPPAPTAEEMRKQHEAAIEEAKRRLKAEAEEKARKKKEERARMIEAQKKEIEEKAVVMPDGLFDVVCMDPPWNYGREYDPETSRVANPYPEMTQAELLEMNPPFAKDCVLFLWTTHAFIWDAKELLDKWGFTYKATLVWDKEKMGMGAWFRMQCEFCLVAIKGKPFFQNTKWRDIIREPRREHSRKPEAFYNMVTEVTAGRRLEFFSREQREGWEVFGNDIKKF